MDQDNSLLFASDTKMSFRADDSFEEDKAAHEIVNDENDDGDVFCTESSEEGE